jgi:NCAIR mutase (PurE)-related protein
MTEREIQQVLDGYKAGSLTIDDALGRLRQLPFEDLGFATVDHHRSLRQGFPEVVFGQGKSVGQVARIVEALDKHDHNILVTRTDEAHYRAVLEVAPFYSSIYRRSGSCVTHKIL